MPDPEIVVRGRGDFSRLNRDLAGAESRFGKLGSNIKRGLGLAAVAGGAALVKLGVDAVQASSDAQQSIGATESVFGRYADLVIKRSGDAADALGLSANEYRELANVTGAMLSNAGTPLREVADLTHKLERRAADLAATFGGTTADAIESVNALLRGETDPIEKYGISIREADISARLAAKGLDDLTGSALKQAQQQARLDLLFKQSKKSAGQFADEADTLAGASQRLDAKVENVSAKFGDLLVPALTDAAEWAGDELVPKLEELAGWLEENKGEIAAFGGTVKDSVLPPLRDLVELGGDVVGFFSGLPEPVQQLGIQAGIAALVFPRLSSAVTGATGTMSGYIGRVRDAETRTAALGRAARTTAGIAGMVALTQGAQETNQGLKDLLSVLGGAATGFAVGGPIGAVIGGAAGALSAVATATDDAADSMTPAIEAAGNYATTLDQLTGASKRATRAEAARALQAQGAFELARQVGISTRDLVGATLGQEDALRRVEGALSGSKGQMEVWVDAMGNVHGTFVDGQGAMTESALKLSNILGVETDELRNQQQATQDVAIASGKLSRALKDVNARGKIVSRLEMSGDWPTSERQVARLIRGLNLTPKRVRTLMEVLGVEGSVKRVRELVRQLEDAKRPRRGKLDVDDKPARGKIQGLEGFMRQLEVKPRRAKMDLDDQAARNKGDSLDRMLGGLGPYSPKVDVPVPYEDRDRINAVFGSLGPWSAQVNITYNDPGRPSGAGGGKTTSTPAAALFGRGWEAAAEKDGQTILDRILKNINKGTRSDVSSGLSRLSDYLRQQIEKNINLKNDKLETKRERERYRDLLKSLDGVYDKLRRNARAQDVINKKLEKARANLQEIRGWVDQVKQSFIETGNITNLGVLEDGTVSIQNLLTQLENERNDALRFAEIIRQLSDETGVKLNDTSLQQLLDKGPEGALAAAEALLSGGDAALDRINELTGEIADAGQQLGSSLSGEFFKVGEDAAEGIVRGLERRAKQLDRIADRLGERLGDAIRDALNGGGRGGGRGAGLLELGATSARSLAPAAVVATAPQTFRFEFSASVMDQIRSGKRAVAEVDLAQQVGVRQVAVTVSPR